MKAKGKWGVVLTIVSVGGLLYTIYLTAKKAPEAKEAVDAALEAKKASTGDENAQLTKAETVEAQMKCYAPVALSALATAGSIVGSQFLPQSAMRDIEKVHETYKAFNRKLNGEKAEKAIEEMTTQKLTEGAKGGNIKKETFVLRFDPISGEDMAGKEIIFETTLLDVMEAEYEINRYFQVARSQLTFNEMLDFFHVPEHVEGGDVVGWEEYLGEVYFGYSWIDFNHRKAMRNGEPVTYIELPFQCHDLTESGCEKQFGHTTVINHGTE